MAKDTENEEFVIDREEIDEDNDATMQSVLAEFDKTEENVKLQIKVYRVAGAQNVKGQRERFLFYADPSEFPILDRVRDTYGSGIYRVRIYKTVGNRTALVRAFDFDIEAPDPKSAPVNHQSELALVLTAMREEQAATRSLLERIMERPQERTTIDPLAMVERTVTLAASLAGLKSEQPSGLSVENMMALISKGMEIGQQAAGNGGGAEPKGAWDAIVAAFNSPLVTDILSRQLAPPASPSATPWQAPTPSTAMPIHPVNQQIPQANGLPPEAMFFAHIVGQLDDLAKRAVDVVQVVPWVHAKVPSEMLGEILNDPLALDKLTAGFPAVREQRGWFAALLSELRKAETQGFDPDGGDGLDGDTGRNTRYPGDTQNRAPDGSPGHS